jgi:hypothetical protein
VATRRSQPFSKRVRSKFAGAKVPTRASGQLAGGCYVWDANLGRYAAEVIDVPTLRGSRISAVTAFGPAAIFPRFGVPLELPADAEAG